MARATRDQFFDEAASSSWTQPRGIAKAVWYLWIWFCLLVVLIYLKIFNRTRFEGLEHIPPTGPILIVSNHISDLDPALLCSAVLIRYPKQLPRAVAKVELFRAPFIGSMIRSYGAISVDRTGKDVRAMREIVRAMKSGKVLIFPEGTRSMDGKLLPGKRPVGRLIHIARPLIIPAAIWGTITTVPPTSIIPRIGKDIGIRFGPPLDMNRLYDLPPTKEASQQIIDHIMESISKMTEDLMQEGRIIEI
jgi:1-acyl-sn-glycerol-3-phosphate acyltransferase